MPILTDIYQTRSGLELLPVCVIMLIFKTFQIRATLAELSEESRCSSCLRWAGAFKPSAFQALYHRPRPQEALI